MSQELADPVRDFFISNGRTLTYKRGVSIIRPEHPSHGVYMIESGYIKIYTLSKSGEVNLHKFITKGHVMPLIWGIEMDPRHLLDNAYFETVTHCKLLMVSKEEFLHQFENNTVFNRKVVELIVRMLHEAINRVNNLSLRTVREKLSYKLVSLAYAAGVEENGSYRINFPVKQYELADWISVSHETVSREMRQLANKGIAEHEDGTLTIRDIDALKKIAEFSIDG